MFTAHSIQKILNVPGPIQCKLNHIQMGHHPIMFRYVHLLSTFNKDLCDEILISFSIFKDNLKH